MLIGFPFHSRIFSIYIIEMSKNRRNLSFQHRGQVTTKNRMDLDHNDHNMKGKKSVMTY